VLKDPRFSSGLSRSGFSSGFSRPGFNSGERTTLTPQAALRRRGWPAAGVPSSELEGEGGVYSEVFWPAASAVCDDAEGVGGSL